METLWGKSAPSTWNVGMAAVRNWSDELLHRGKRKEPLLPDHLKFKKIPSRLPKPVPEDEISRLLSEVKDPQDLLLFEVLASTGLRATEVATLRFRNIDTHGIVTVIGKGNKERQTFMTDTAMEALKRWVVYGLCGNITPQSEADVHDIFWSYHKKNLEEGIFLNSKDEPVAEMYRPGNWLAYRVKLYTEHSPHKFRHFWVTDLLNNGADMMAVMDAAGHDSIRTTRQYKKVLKREMTALRSNHSRQQGRL